MTGSNIRVFVRWTDSTVFAGEDIECTITFANVAAAEGRARSPASRQHGFVNGGERQRRLPPVHSSTRPTVSRNSSFASQLPPPPQTVRAAHRPTLSLSLHTPGNSAAAQRHGRSLSIVSLNTNAATDASLDRGPAARRPPRGHARSASLQVVPGRPNSYPSTDRREAALACFFD